MDIGQRWRRLVVVCVLALSIVPWQAVSTRGVAQASATQTLSEAV